MNSETTFCCNDLNFIYNSFDLNPGANRLSTDKDTWVEIELRIVPTVWSGTCFVMQARRQQNWHTHTDIVYVGYNKGLDLLDVPKMFKIYFTPKDEWQSIVIDNGINSIDSYMISAVWKK